MNTQTCSLPAGATGEPTTSTVNFGAGTTEPNAATVALSSAGELQVWVFMPTPSATAEVLIDVVGYTIDHDHDDRYYTETEVDTKLAAKANTSAVYTKSQSDDRYPTGFANVIETFTDSWVPDDVLYFEAYCPVGLTPVGGGASADDDGLAIDSSFPVPEDGSPLEGWAVYYRNVSGVTKTDLDVWVHIICMDIPGEAGSSGAGPGLKSPAPTLPDD